MKVRECPNREDHTWEDISPFGSIGTDWLCTTCLVRVTISEYTFPNMIPQKLNNV